MRGKLLTGALVLVILATAFVQLRNTLNSQSSPDPNASIRNSIVRSYLIGVKLTETPFDESFGPALSDFLERMETKAPTVMEAVAVIYHLENRPQKVEATLNKMAVDYPLSPLLYALGKGEPGVEALPPDWEARVTDDWIGARMRALIHERSHNQAAEAQARLEMIKHLDEARLYNQIKGPRELFSLVGLGLLISMFLSDRQWRRLGKDTFFQLKPLHFKSDLVLRFSLPFFLGLFVISLVLGALTGVPLWLREVLGSVLYIAVGVVLLRTVIFDNEPGLMTETLELDQLAMRPYNLVQILGGFAMVTACHFYAEMLSGLVHWPIYSYDSSETLRALAGSPLAMAVYGFAACLLAPFFEEIFFRGFLLRVLLNNMRPMAALWCSALLFGVMHPFALWPLIVFKGFALGVIYFRTANLMVVIGTHAVWNLVVLLIGVSGFSGG